MSKLRKLGIPVLKVAPQAPNTERVVESAIPQKVRVVVTRRSGCNQSKSKAAVKENKPLPRTTTRPAMKSVITKPVVSKPLLNHLTTAGPSGVSRKRPLMGGKAGTDATVPKVAKPTKSTGDVKIAPYDYKARFNNLKEKHISLRESHEAMKQEIANAKEELLRNADVEKRLIALEAVNKSLNKSYVFTKSKLVTSEKDLRELESVHKKLVDANETLTQEHREVAAKYASIRVSFENTKIQLEECTEELQRSKKSLIANEQLRRELHNTVQDLKGNIRVFCRCRPQKDDETEKALCSFNYVDEHSLELVKSVNGAAPDAKHEFTFDRVFPPESTQDDVFEDLSQLVQSALDGYNVCVFAYGQTGSGKTYTMIGDLTGNAQGMIPKSVRLLFERINDLELSGWEYRVETFVLEIYNENIRDLLNPSSKQQHEIRFNEGKGTVVTNLTVEPITTADELQAVMTRAQKNRVVAATNFNEHSSRSHAVIKISLEGRNRSSNVVYSGSLNLVDLAGSENAKNSERMTETKAINKSLANLGNVMLALHNRDSHVPYRNSKLTYLLQSSLGGNSKTLMFVNISPFQENFNETVNSLRFAGKVKNVKTSSKRTKTFIK